MSDSFDAALTPFMVAAQHGWTAFVAVALDHPDQFRGQQLLVAELYGRTIGFADFRAPGDASGFLSYICVHSSVRGRGVARELLRECVRRSGSLTSVSLDVFENNEPARAMYKGLGFSASDVQVWWRAGLPAIAASGLLSLEGLAVALAAHDRYGFCEFSGTHAGRPVRVGRVGQTVLRLFSATDFNDEDLTASLAMTFPDLADTFTVLPAGVVPTVAGAAQVNRAIRMTTRDVPRLLGAP